MPSDLSEAKIAPAYILLEDGAHYIHANFELIPCHSTENSTYTHRLYQGSLNLLWCQTQYNSTLTAYSKNKNLNTSIIGEMGVVNQY